MAITLRKSGKITWHPAGRPYLTKARIVLSKGRAEPACEIELSAILVGQNEKMWKDNSIVCRSTAFDRTVSAEGVRVWDCSDTTLSWATECIELDLSKVEPCTYSIVIGISSSGVREAVPFGSLTGLDVRIYDLSGESSTMIADLDLLEDWGSWTSMAVGAFYREGQQWKLLCRGWGIGVGQSGLEELIARYCDPETGQGHERP